MIPGMSPLIMFLRIVVLTPPMWQILLSIALLVLGILGVVWIAARVYRVGILMYGKRPTFPEIVRWVRHGTAAAARASYQPSRRAIATPPTSVSSRTPASMSTTASRARPSPLRQEASRPIARRRAGRPPRTTTRAPRARAARVGWKAAHLQHPVGRGGARQASGVRGVEHRTHGTRHASSTLIAARSRSRPAVGHFRRPVESPQEQRRHAKGDAADRQPTQHVPKEVTAEVHPRQGHDERPQQASVAARRQPKKRLVARTNATAALA